MILFIFGLLQFSCLSRIDRNDGQASAPNCETISQETAVLIAKGELFVNYDLKDYEVIVDGHSDYWQVGFRSKCKNCEGGDPYVQIDKSNGRVIKTDLPK